MAQLKYLYLQIEIKEDSVVVSGDSSRVFNVETMFSGIPGIQLSRIGLIYAQELTITSEDYSKNLLKMGVVCLFKDLEVVPSTMFVDLSNGTEKIIFRFPSEL